MEKLNVLDSHLRCNECTQCFRENGVATGRLTIGDVHGVPPDHRACHSQSHVLYYLTGLSLGCNLYQT